MKRILFLSALDYKQRSIQVNRLTPEYYAKKGWEVQAIVCRDESQYGDYYYEPIVDPAGVKVWRRQMLLSKAAERMPSLLRRVVRKLDVVANTVGMARTAARLHRQQPFDVIYGYEVQGALAACIAGGCMTRRNCRIVTRFQGSHLYQYFEGKQWIELLKKADHIVAMMVPADLTVMTDDGTRGDRLLQLLRVSPQRKVRFWPNGVERTVDHAPERLITRGTLKSLSVSRLVGWKRVDRVLRIIAALRKLRPDIVIDHRIVGEGEERGRLEQLSAELGLADVVKFAGAVNHELVLQEYATRPLFLSMYAGSNAGNPLFEAMRRHCVIVTLANGSTAKWIEHGVNGFAYDCEDVKPERVARDIVALLASPDRLKEIINNIAVTERTKLWTWDERLEAEVAEVEQLVPAAQNAVSSSPPAKAMQPSDGSGHSV